MAPKTHKAVTNRQNLEINQDIWVEIVKKNDVGGASEEMEKPPKKRQVGRLSGVDDQVAAAGITQKTQHDAQTKKDPINDSSTNALWPNARSMSATNTALLGIRCAGIGTVHACLPAYIRI